MFINLKQNNYKFIIIISIIILFIITILYFKTSKDNNIKSNNEQFINQTVSPAIYTYTGNSDIWIVPQGVTQATFTVIGGKGGNIVYGSETMGTGGNGAIVTTTLTNLSGTLTICVGGNGVGAIYGGGSAGLSTASQGGSGGIGYNWGGNGGAASCVLINNTFAIIAGGGGGAAWGANGGNGSNANTLSGGNGSGPNYVVNTGGVGGGSGVIDTIENGQSKIKQSDRNSDYGGGGGGWKGGLVGSITQNGGGAGSSYVISTNSSNTSYGPDITGTPSITITWTLPTTQFQPTTTQFQPTTTQFQPTTTQFQTLSTASTASTASTVSTVSTVSTASTASTTTNPNSMSENIPLTTYGYNIPKNQSKSSPETEIYQHNFEGTSNVYSPAIYYNMESFDPLNLYDDYYAPY